MRSQLSQDLNEMQFKGQYEMIENQKTNKLKYISCFVLLLALTGNIFYAATKISSQSSDIQPDTQNNPNPPFKINKTVVNHITVRQLQNAILLKKGLISLNADLSSLEDQKLLQRYQLQEFKELPMCVFTIVDQKKNMELFLKSLSVQKYSNFRVLLIDETGDGGFEQQFQKVAKRYSGLDGKITVKSNVLHEGYLSNVLSAAKNFCKPNEIIIEYSQKSLILGTFVFKIFNQIFHSSEVWVAYGSALQNNNKVAEYGEYHRDVVDSSTFRKQPFLLGNIIAYASDLINHINESDVKSLKGEEYKFEAKRAFYLTLLELAKKKIRFIPQIIEAQLKENKSLKDHNEEQQKQIRERKPAKAVGSLKHLPSY